MSRQRWRRSESPLARRRPWRAAVARSPISGSRASSASRRRRCAPTSLLQPGDQWDAERVDQSLKALFATGLFADVKLIRDGSTLVVKVVENPIINRIAFEGNSKLDRQGPQLGNPAAAARRLYPHPGAERCRRASSSCTAATAASPRPSNPRSSSFRRTASISCSRSTRARRPACAASISSATRISATARCAASSIPRKAAGIAFCRPPTPMTPTG